MINLNNFVNVNINYDPITSSSGSRPMVVILDDNSTWTDTTQRPTSDNCKWASEADYIKELGLGSNTKLTYTQLYKMVSVFFKNGGKKIHYIRVENDSQNAKLIAAIKNLSNEEIIITGCFTTEDKLFNIMKSINEDTDMKNNYEKFFLLSDTYTESNSKYSFGWLGGIDWDKYPNAALKIGDPGIEMTIAAYLSKIDIDNGSIQDYCFTGEYLGSSDDPLYEGNIISDNSVFKELKDENRFNMNISLAQQEELTSYDSRNFGGNTVDKHDLVNYYVKIILTQTLNSALLTLLKNKLKYSQTSLSLISATIIEEMNRYKKAGYISTDKVWNKGDKYTEDGYLLLKNNTAFTRGYELSILPLSSLSSQDKLDHKLPPIYLFIADSYSIREISLNGTIF